MPKLAASVRAGGGGGNSLSLNVLPILRFAVILNIQIRKRVGIFCVSKKQIFNLLIFDPSVGKKIFDFQIF